MISPGIAALAVSATVLAAPPPSVAPPATGGQWHQLGRAVASKPGQIAHFFRTATSPTALAVVATSSSARPIRMTWFSYCEFESDDAQTEEHQATVIGIGRVVALPHVLDGATLCNVSVTIRVANGRAAAAIFRG
jgi:hypothetical protein